MTGPSSATLLQKQRTVVPELRSIPLTFMDCPVLNAFSDGSFPDSGILRPCWNHCEEKRNTEGCPRGFP